MTVQFKPVILCRALFNIPIDNAIPLSMLQKEIPVQAERQDLYYFYFREFAFDILCGQYEESATARYLYDLHMLKHPSDSFTYRAKSKLFGIERPRVYAIRKSIIDLPLL